MFEMMKKLLKKHLIFLHQAEAFDVHKLGISGLSFQLNALKPLTYRGPNCRSDFHIPTVYTAVRLVGHSIAAKCILMHYQL